MLDEKIIRIDTFKIFIAILVIPLIRPEGLKYINPFLFLVMFKYLTYLVIGIIFLLYVKKTLMESIRINSITLFIIILFLVDLIITISKAGDVFGLVKLYFTSISLLMIVQVYRNRIYDIIDVIFNWLALLLTINMVYMILYPKGVYKSTSVEGYTANWFLGYKSSFQYYIFPAVIFAILNIINKRKALINYWVLVLGHLETILSANKMLLMGLVIIDLFCLSGIYKRFKIVNMVSYLLFVVFINGLFIFTNASNAGFISYIITNILKKNLTVGRGRIWRITLNEISKAPILGHGYQDSAVRYAMYGRVNHAHNQVLEFIYQGGIVLLFIYTLILITTAILLMRYWDNGVAQFISLAVFTIMIMTSVEVFTLNSGVLFWLMFSLSGEIEMLSINQEAQEYMDKAV